MNVETISFWGQNINCKNLKKSRHPFLKIFKNYLSNKDLGACRETCQLWRNLVEDIKIGRKVLQRSDLILAEGKTWVQAYRESPKIYLVIDSSYYMKGIYRVARAKLRELAVRSLKCSLRTLTIGSFAEHYSSWEANSIDDVDQIIKDLKIRHFDNFQHAINSIISLHLKKNIQSIVRVISGFEHKTNDFRYRLRPPEEDEGLAKLQIFFHLMPGDSIVSRIFEKYPIVKERGVKRKIEVLTCEEDYEDKNMGLDQNK